MCIEIINITCVLCIQKIKKHEIYENYLPNISREN